MVRNLKSKSSPSTAKVPLDKLLTCGVILRILVLAIML